MSNAEKENLLKLTKEELIARIRGESSGKNPHDLIDNDMSIDFRSLLEAASDIIFIIDKNGHLKYINSAWQKFYPSRLKDSLGKNYTEYIPDFEKSRAIFVFDSVIKEGHIFQDEIMKTSDEKGNDVYFNISFSPIRHKDSGAISGMLGIMRNITENYLMEKRLKKNTKMLEDKVKEQIRQAQELKELRDFNEEFIYNAPIGILMMDPSGIILSENPTLKKIMGREAGDSVVGVNLLYYEGFIESGFDIIFREGLEKKKTIKAYETRYIPIAKNRELSINLTMTPILEKGGGVEKVIVMVEDVTDQVRISRKMHRADKVSSLGFLASGVASELKDHINKMFMDLNFIALNVDERNPAFEYIPSMKNDLERIKGISEQLLSLAATDETEKESIEINKILTSHTIEVVINRIKGKGIDMEIVLSKSNPIVNATQNQLQQLLIQLIENAEEAISENRRGKIKIMISTHIADDARVAAISISDTGIGISEENIKKIFRPFYSTKGKQATGLGMMIVSAILGNLGGTIGVKSLPAVGTTFKITLPLCET